MGFTISGYLCHELLGIPVYERRNLFSIIIREEILHLPDIASVTYSASAAHLNGYKYSGTVTVSVDSGASDNASFTVSGSVGTDSDAKSITVNKPVETTYSVEVKPVGTYEGSHNDSFTFNAYLVTYENDVEKSRKDISNSSYTSWKRGDYDFALLVNKQTVSSQYSGDEYHDKDSGDIVATYDGPEGKYSGRHTVLFRETYNVNSTIERELTSGNTRIRVKLSADAPVQLYFYLTSTTTLPDHNNGISAGDKYGEWILSLPQSDVDDLSVYMIRTWDNKSVYYDSNDKTYYYF